MTTAVIDPKTGPVAPAVSAPSWQGSPWYRQVWVLTQRSLTALVRDPRMVVFSLLQPLVMLALFSQIFSGISSAKGFPPGLSYIDYLMPAILVNTSMGSAIQSGVGLVNDMKNGVLARFRSLPIRMSSVLVARSLSDLARTAFQLAVMLIFAAAVFDFRPSGGVLGVLAAYGLGLLLGWGLTWVFLAVGSWLRNAEVMQMAGFLLMFPLMFASSAYVPIGTLPTWLQVVAHVNPMTYAVNSARDLALGMPVGTGVLSALGTSAVLLIIGWFAAVKGFKRPL